MIGKVSGLAFAVLAAAVVLAGCSSDPAGTPSSTPPTSDTFTPPSVAPVPSVEIVTSAPASSAKLTAGDRDKFIRLLYAKYTEEWVVEKPGTWIDLAQTSCTSLRKGNDESDIVDILGEQLTSGAARWFLATSKTLICPDVP